MRKLLFLIAVVLAIGTPVMAAGERAALSGTVTDESGSIIPGVTVTVTNTDTNQTLECLSNDSGFYSFPTLIIGPYKLEASLDGFQKYEQTGIRLQVGQNVRSDVVLKVGAISSVVTVQADVMQVNTVDATLGQVINDKIIERMPLNGRNFVQLATLTPGVTRGTYGAMDGAAGNAETMRYYWSGNASMSANGVRENQNNFMLDGVDNNESFVGSISIFPNLDAIAEFKVETSNASAEFGRAGGALVNATLKSGTNDINGTLFWFVRNEIFDANSWENNKNAPQDQAEKTPLRQNQFGFTIGGPIIKNKTFFFGDYQGLRLRIPQPSTVNVPTVAERSPSNYVGVVDPVAINYFNAFPLPNVGTNQYADNQRSRSTTSDQFDIRIDHNFSENDNMFGRFSWARDHTIMGSKLPLPLYAGWGSGDNSGNTWGAALGETHIFSPSLVNEFRAGFHRVHLGWFPTNYGIMAADEIGIPGVNFDDLTSGMPLINVNGLEWVGDYGPYTLPENTFSYNDTLTWITGKHTFKFGFNLNRRQQNYFQQQWAKGFYEFNSVNDCATGWANHAAKGALHGSFGMRSWELGLFAQDDWKLTSRLTVNLGLRWDIFTPITEVLGRESNFNLVSFAGQPEATQFMVDGNNLKTRYTNFGPRIGFAYSLTEDSKTVLRAGYGVFYAVENGGLDTSLSSNYPYSNVMESWGANIYRLSVAIPYPPPADPANPRGLVKWREIEAHTPFVQQWNLTLERELFRDLLVSGSYVGTRGTFLGGVRNINFPASFDVNGNNWTRPFTHVTDNIMAYEFRANSFYHALQLKADKRFSNGFAILGSYTWSHSIDDSPGAISGYGTGGMAAEPQDVYNLRAERANSGYDIRHRFSCSFIWDLPFGKGRKYGSDVGSVANFFIGGWQLNGIITFESGGWFTPNVWNRMGSLPIHWGSSRPDRVGDGNLPYGDRSPDHWFNYAAFDDKLGDPVHYGNAGRNILNGPRYRTIDMALYKDFPIFAETKLEFRWEVFNILNTPQFNYPESSVNSESWNGNIGRITGTRNASWRIMQFSLKYIF
ncbi:MAG: TonB-dependent receptor [Acidobacteria bacterium]|nr:TonB-dependent receptor [Acidobacteriota bacterium]